MSKIELFHSFDHLIKKSDFHLSKINNDYGRGFNSEMSIKMPSHL